MTRPPLDLLTSQSFPDLAAGLRKASDAIVQHWVAMVRDALPKCDEMTFAEVRDSLPQVLEQIARALESEQAPGVRFLGDITAEHGVVRFNQQFNLAEVLQEYVLLRAVMFQEVGSAMKRSMSIEEVAALNVGLDVAVRRAVVAFTSHQEKQLQAATEAQSKYLSFLSHDLRGGLNGVFLMIEVLKRELSGEERLAETVQDLDVMRRSLLETVGTMDRFLHAERFRKGKVQVRPAPIRLKNLLSDIAAQFSYQARDKELELHVEVPADCEIISDRELLSLIVQNLVSNAIKYSQHGRVEIGSSMAPDTCKVWVEDNGPGIAPDKLNQLFAPFERGETYGQPGVGLGLSIARQAANYLHAKLWAESTVGKGSTFYVEFPRKLESRA